MGEFPDSTTSLCRGSGRRAVRSTILDGTYRERLLRFLFIVRLGSRTRLQNVQTLREDVTRSVDIPVMCTSATRTCPLSVIERHALEDVATLVAHLRGREESVDLDEVPSIPLALVFELPQQLAPRAISDCSGELVILHHVLHLQRLDCYHLVFANQTGRQLVDMILPLV